SSTHTFTSSYIGKSPSTGMFNCRDNGIMPSQSNLLKAVANCKYGVISVCSPEIVSKIVSDNGNCVTITFIGRFRREAISENRPTKKYSEKFFLYFRRATFSHA